jgi:hypothetical protein
VLVHGSVPGLGRDSPAGGGAGVTLEPLSCRQCGITIAA